MILYLEAKEGEPIVVRWTHLFDGGRAKDEEFQIDPFFLFVSEQLVTQHSLLLSLEGAHNDAHKEIQEKEKTYHHVEDEE
jgi:hypothetical protein